MGAWLSGLLVLKELRRLGQMLPLLSRSSASSPCSPQWCSCGAARGHRSCREWFCGSISGWQSPTWFFTCWESSVQLGLSPLLCLLLDGRLRRSRRDPTVVGSSQRGGGDAVAQDACGGQPGPCPFCHGTGRCAMCGGTGTRMVHRHWPMRDRPHDCRACGGTGDCQLCHRRDVPGTIRQA